VGSKFVWALVAILFCFGGLVLTSFLVQVTTGFALTFYYRPSVSEALASVRSVAIVSGVPDCIPLVGQVLVELIRGGPSHVVHPDASVLRVPATASSYAAQPDGISHVFGSADVAILTFLGGLLPASDSLYISDIAHHHLAVGIIAVLIGAGLPVGGSRQMPCCVRQMGCSIVLGALHVYLHAWADARLEASRVSDRCGGRW
jgi:hypothetical protein